MRASEQAPPRSSRLFLTLRAPLLGVLLPAATTHQQLKRFAAGALFNTVESISRDSALKSLDAQIKQRVGGGGDGDASPSQNRVSGVFGAMFGDREEEVELSKETLVELAKREADEDERLRNREFAATLVQNIFRRKRNFRNYNVLKKIAKAVKIIKRGVQQYRRIRRRKAALIIQVYARAYILHNLGICPRSTALAVINGTRRAYNRCLVRMVARRFVLLNIEQKRRKAMALVVSAKKAQGKGLIKTPARAKIVVSASERSAEQKADDARWKWQDAGKMADKASSVRKQLDFRADGPTKAQESQAQVAASSDDKWNSEPTDPRKLKKSPSGGALSSGAALVSSLMPRSVSGTLTNAVSGRIPIMRKIGWGTPGSSKKQTPAMTPAMTPRAGAASNDVEDIETGIRKPAQYASPESGASAAAARSPATSQVPALNIPKSGATPKVPVPALSIPNPGAILAAAAARADAARAAQQADVESGSPEMDRRRMTASASKSVLGTVISVENDDLPAGYNPPIRRLFPPGASAAKFAAAGGAALSPAQSPAKLQTSMSYAALPARSPSVLTTATAGVDSGAGIGATTPANFVTPRAPGGAVPLRPSASAAVLRTSPRATPSQPTTSPRASRYDPSQAATMYGGDVDPDSLASPDDLESGYRAPVRKPSEP